MLGIQFFSLLSLFAMALVNATGLETGISLASGFELFSVLAQVGVIGLTWRTVGIWLAMVLKVWSFYRST